MDVVVMLVFSEWLKLRGYIFDVLKYFFICVSGRGPVTARWTPVMPALLRTFHSTISPFYLPHHDITLSHNSP